MVLKGTISCAEYTTILLFSQTQTHIIHIEDVTGFPADAGSPHSGWDPAVIVYCDNCADLSMTDAEL